MTIAVVNAANPATRKGIVCRSRWLSLMVS